MRPQVYPSAVGILLIIVFLGTLILPDHAKAAGVTVITHGYDSDVNTWVTSMADQLPNYSSFPGTNFTTYRITLTTDGTSYFYQWSRTNGVAPSLTDSGEIIVKLDWSQMAGGPSAPYDISTFQVASVARSVLLQTNAISELSGHALAEFPIHLIGHSRGGSLVSELSRQLGTNGLWVDHLTTLDPHPLNNDGNSEPFLPTDASARNTYENVLFADNYWQDLGDGFFVPNGEPVAGAYVRQLANLSGGYSSSHSDVHLWYHGTVAWQTPVSDTGGGSITSSERQAWWTPYEQQGTNAGFEFSLIGGANRLSQDQPLGPGNPAIVDGYNQRWNFGAGAANNRTTLSANSGSWPNLIKFNLTDAGQAVQGQSILIKFFYQWAQPASSNATLSVYLDDDSNPLNSNQELVAQISLPGSGSSSVNSGTFSVPLFATNASPGWHSLLAKMVAGGKTRYLYAPELVQVLPNQQPPRLDIARIGSSQFQIAVNAMPGQTVVLQSSADLLSWQPLATNTFVASRWTYTNNAPSATPLRFYRGMLAN